MSKQYLEVPFEIKAEDITDEGIFSGWGSLFDQEPDAGRDIVARGAFYDTLAKGGRNRTGIMMGWQHDTRGMPPGVWLELREEPKGLYVKGQLDLNTQLGRDILSIMKLGAKTGTWRFSLSIGYDSIEEEYQTIKVGAENIDIRVRLLKKVELWEVSIVNFPMKLGATIIDVKDAIQKAKTERELEKALRESGNVSKSDAQHIISLVKAVLRDSKSKEEEEQAMMNDLLDSLAKTNRDMKFIKSLCELNLN